MYLFISIKYIKLYVSSKRLFALPQWVVCLSSRFHCILLTMILLNGSLLLKQVMKQYPWPRFFFIRRSYVWFSLENFFFYILRNIFLKYILLNIYIIEKIFISLITIVLDSLFNYLGFFGGESYFSLILRIVVINYIECN